MAFFKEKEGISLDPSSSKVHWLLRHAGGHFGLTGDFSSNLFCLAPDGNIQYDCQQS